jgi:hypothetical protein
MRREARRMERFGAVSECESRDDLLNSRAAPRVSAIARPTRHPATRSARLDSFLES